MKNRILIANGHRVLTKTKNQKIELGKSLLIVFGAVFLFTAPFVHMLFPKENRVVELFKTDLYKTTIKPIELRILENRKRYDTSQISAKEYIDQNDLLISKFNEVNKQNKILIEQTIDKNRFFGWRSVRSFFIGFGIRIVIVFLTLILTFTISLIKIQDVYLKKAFRFLEISCWGLSVYLLVWCFWKDQDFPLSAYRLAVVCGSVLIGSGMVYFVSYKQKRKNIESEEKIKFRNETQLIFEELKEELLSK